MILDRIEWHFQLRYIACAFPVYLKLIQNLTRMVS